LCHKCHSNIKIRNQYPHHCAKRARRNEDDSFGPKLPAVPTDQLPGTEGKIRIMIERFEERVSVFHPFDVKWDDLSMEVAQMPRLNDASSNIEAVANERVIRSWLDKVLEDADRAADDDYLSDISPNDGKIEP
jgi:hypothetical protein